MIEIPTERVPKVGGVRRVLKSELLNYLQPAQIRYDGDHVVVLYSDELPPAAPADPMPNIVVSPRQIRTALSQANLRTQVEAAVATGPQALKDWWEYATAFESKHAEVQAMGAALSKSPAEVYAVFQLAQSL